VRNLVSNALKFTPKDGVVRVSMDLVNAETVENEQVSTLKISVTDNGVGMTEEQQAQLFTDIVQFNPGKLQNGGGSGIGLYISNSIILLHEGQLSVQSEGEGRGSTFTISIPAFIREDSIRSIVRSGVRPMSSYLTNGARHARVCADCTVSPKHHLKSSHDSCVSSPVSEFSISSVITSISSQHDRVVSLEVSRAFLQESPESMFQWNRSIQSYLPRVLLVDDSVMNRKMQCRLLSTRSLVCDEASNGAEAVEIIRNLMNKEKEKEIKHEIERDEENSYNENNMYDMILMDYHMPVLSGIEAARQMRELGYNGLIIGLTGNVDTESSKKFISYGANTVLYKPMEVKELDAILKNYTFPDLSVRRNTLNLHRCS